MRKTFVILGALLFSSLVFARYPDKTYIGYLNSHETKTTLVRVPAASSRIEVLPTKEQEFISCQFVDASSGLASKVYSHVNKCYGNLNKNQEVSINVKVTNDQDHLIDYRIVIHSF